MTQKGSKTHREGQQPRPAHRIYEQGGRKLPELAVCPECRASYRNGRWTWKAAPADAYEHLCPACERIADDYPAGVLHVGGAFAAEHRDELVALIRKHEERERAAHPLNRLMSIEDEGSGFLVKTTYANLVQSLGRALEKAYDGRLEHPPTSGERDSLVRVRWSRP